MWSRNRRKAHLETVLPGDPSHIQLPNPDTIVDANKCLLTNSEVYAHSHSFGLSTGLPIEELEKASRDDAVWSRAP